MTAELEFVGKKPLSRTAFVMTISKGRSRRNHSFVACQAVGECLQREEVEQTVCQPTLGAVSPKFAEKTGDMEGKVSPWSPVTSVTQGVTLTCS